jgi:hypothetical protein
MLENKTVIVDLQFTIVFVWFSVVLIGFAEF